MNYKVTFKKSGYDDEITTMPDVPLADVHYVHELQQLLRLGGYTELAINVEV